MDANLDLIVKLVAALLAGGLIGLNRDLHGKPAGIRVHALVSLGAAIVILAALEGGNPANINPVIQGIVGGIGFLGAGIIMRAEVPGSGMRLHNLTTASTIWVSAALGIACGVGAWRLATAASLAVFAVLILGVRLDRWLYGRLGDEADGGDDKA